MGQLLLELKSIELASPFLFLITFLTLFVVIFVVTIMWRDKSGSIKLADIGNIGHVGAITSAVYAVINIVFMVFIAFLASVLIAGPSLFYEKTIQSSTTKYVSTVVLLDDISSSMKLANKGAAEGTDRSIFELLKDAQVKYLEQAKDTRVGLIFYSNDALSYRFPTDDLEALARTLKGIELSGFNRSTRITDIGKNQISRMSMGTNTSKGLKSAGRMVRLALSASDEDVKDSAIILFSDLQDNTASIKKAVKELTSMGIRVYFVTDANETLLGDYNDLVGTDANFEIFSVSSAQELETAFSKLANIEKNPVVVREIISTENELTEEVAFTLLIVLVMWTLTFELFTHNARERRQL